MAIAVLSAQVINQIAAGEVIERPASVVKELVENSLDAGALRVQVAVESGGTGLIRVTDDGQGIAAGEVELAFARHATSKLRQLDDLFTIGTLGFRGEALPSIASVAKVSLTTRPPGEELGWRVVIEGGQVVSSGSCGAPAGTTVEVRDLFFNTPARRKFLRSEPAEASRIAGVLTGLAAIHPEIAFVLTSEGRVVLRTTGEGNPAETLAGLVGTAPGRLLTVRGGFAGVEVDGLAGAPDLTWANRTWQLFAVNGRLVESRALQVATEKAYGGLLPVRRFPVALLRLNVDPALVDVNVHPAKREVRFRREGDLFQAVQHSVSEALTSQPLYRAMPLSGSGVLPVVRTPAYAPDAFGGEAGRLALNWTSSAAGQRVNESGPEPLSPAPVDVEPVQEAAPQGEGVRYLGQVVGSYLVGEMGDGLVLVDQHAAHERVIFDALRASLDAGAPLARQQLLLPLEVELTPAESDLLAEILPVLETLGFAVEPFGGRSILVRAVPVLLGRLDLRAVLAETAESAAEGLVSRGGRAALLERLLQGLACHAAVKANHALTGPEAEALLEQWMSSAQPWTCPHGRPIALRWAWAEVAASFLRR